MNKDLLVTDEEIRKDIEKKLKLYFKKEIILKNINIKIKKLKERIERLDNDLKNISINIPIEERAINYGEKVQVSKTGISYAENTAIRITSKMQKLLEKNKVELIELEEKRFSIEVDNDIIENNIKDLNEEYKEILKLIYGKGKTEEFVAQRLNIDRSNVNRRKTFILKNIEHWFLWFS